MQNPNKESTSNAASMIPTIAPIGSVVRVSEEEARAAPAVESGCPVSVKREEAYVIGSVSLGRGSSVGVGEGSTVCRMIDEDVPLVVVVVEMV